MPTIVIHGLEFHIPAPYGAGHPCTPVEADILNRTFADALRNNWAKRVASAKAQGEVEIASLREEFESYASTYSLGTARLKFGDPVEREATKIARALAQESLNAEQAQGKAQYANAEERKCRFDELVDAYLTSPVIQAEARRRVAAMRDTAAKALDLFEEAES